MQTITHAADIHDELLIFSHEVMESIRNGGQLSLVVVNQQLHATVNGSLYIFPIERLMREVDPRTFQEILCEWGRRNTILKVWYPAQLTWQVETVGEVTWVSGRHPNWPLTGKFLGKHLIAVIVGQPQGCSTYHNLTEGGTVFLRPSEAACTWRVGDFPSGVIASHRLDIWLREDTLPQPSQV